MAHLQRLLTESVPCGDHCPCCLCTFTALGFSRRRPPGPGPWLCLQTDLTVLKEPESPLASPRLLRARGQALSFPRAQQLSSGPQPSARRPALRSQPQRPLQRVHRFPLGLRTRAVPPPGRCTHQGALVASGIDGGSSLALSGQLPGHCVMRGRSP